MALEIKVDVPVDFLEKFSKREDLFSNPELLSKTAGEAMLEKVVSHLESKYVPRNSRGDFWARVVESRQFEYDIKGGSITLREPGIALRYHGGEVRPGKSISSFTGELTKALAVPTAEVPVRGGRQLRPGRAGLLAFIRNHTGSRETVGFLVEGVEKTITRGKNKGQKQIVPKTGGGLMYVLRKVTRHRPDKGILPNAFELLQAVEDAIVGDISDLDR